MADTAIDVRRDTTQATPTFAVTITDRGTTSCHVVTVSEECAARFPHAEQLVFASFRFLLDREPKEAILSRFDIKVIANYFPEFPRELANYLARR